MTNKYLKVFSIFNNEKKMQIKATAKSRFRPANKGTSRKQMMVRMWEKSNHYLLLVRIETGAATMESSVKDSLTTFLKGFQLYSS